jgi:hypothetical protein
MPELRIMVELSARHQKALGWFAENAGTVQKWPEPLRGGALLATPAARPSTKNPSEIHTGRRHPHRRRRRASGCLDDLSGRLELGMDARCCAVG